MNHAWDVSDLLENLSVGRTSLLHLMITRISLDFNWIDDDDMFHSFNIMLYSNVTSKDILKICVMLSVFFSVKQQYLIHKM
jgi:hypothetical protein